MQELLSYNEFKEQLVKDMKEKLPQYVINVHKVHKNNVVKDGLSGISKYNSKLAPTLYLNDYYYEEYIDKNMPYNEILKNVIELITSYGKDNQITENGNKAQNILDKLDDIKHNILPRIVNTSTNKDMLSNIIHRNFLDMSIYYVVQIKLDDGVASIKLTNDVLKGKGIKASEEDLFKWSINNLKEYNNYAISMQKVIECLMCNINTKDCTSYSSDDLMIVIQNSENINGANNILNNDLLKEIADTLISDLYIIPSSIHELIIVPKEKAIEINISLCEIKEMVKSVNANNVPYEDKLTDTVYLYTRNTNEVTIAE